MQTDPPDDSGPWWPSRYGPGDELGALNEITSQKVAAAVRLVRQGVVYNLGRVLHADVPRFEDRFWHQTLVTSAHQITGRRAAPRDGAATT